MTFEVPPLLRALVAEDDGALADVLRLAFSRSGFDVQVARNGLDALHIARSTDFDVVCTDFQMPVLDGGQLLGAIRQGGASKDAVLMLCSAKSFELDCERMRQSLGLHAVFYKPFSLAEILTAAHAGLAARVGT